jgi:hypothetical protein
MAPGEPRGDAPKRPSGGEEGREVVSDLTVFWDCGVSALASSLDMAGLFFGVSSILGMLPIPLAVTEGMHTGAVILGVTDVPIDPGKLFASVEATCLMGSDGIR